MKRTEFVCIFAILLMGFGLTLPAMVGDAVKTFKTPGHHPTAMCFDGTLIWLADSGTAELNGIDRETGKVVKTLKAPGYDPVGLAWDGKLLWCIDATEGWIYGINVKTGVAEKILESNSRKPGGMTFDGSYLWMIDKGNKKLLKINRQDGMMHESITAPSPDVKDLTFDGTYIWATDNDDDMLYRVKPYNGNVVTYVRSVGPYPYGICWDGKTLWTADYQTEELCKLDLESKEFLRRMDPKVYRWEIVQEFRNYGPDNVKDLDVFMAVPGNLDNQDILGEIGYDPIPSEFVKDRWGQTFARFKYGDVKSDTVLRSVMKVKARMHNTECYIFPERVGRFSEIPQHLNKYLQDGFKYDIHNPVVQFAVKVALMEETRPYWMMRNIFNYILDHIEYKLKPLGGWNPAPTVLKRGTGSCSEYSFVFIAMCRAAGLPARYAGSVVIRQKDKGIDDVWHRWPEVYLPNYGWIPVDPSAEGSRPYPGDIARLIGTESNRYLITTNSGGDSKYLDFYYNFNTRWKTEGKCRIVSKQYGEFVPVDEE